MSVIRRVSVPVGTTVAVIPPDGKARSGQYQWTVINPAASAAAVELVDAATKTIGDGLELDPGAGWDSLAKGEKVWAAGPASGSAVVVVVTGTAYGD